MFFGNDKANSHSGVCECNECVGIENEMEQRVFQRPVSITEIVKAVFHFNGAYTDVRIETEDLDDRMHGIVILNPDAKTVDVFTKRGELLRSIDCHKITKICADNEYISRNKGETLDYNQFIKIEVYGE